jgi:hypothetical protein
MKHPLPISFKVKDQKTRYHTVDEGENSLEEEPESSVTNNKGELQK